MQRITGARPPKTRLIQIEKGALDSADIERIAQMTEGFAGRDIALMIGDMQEKAYATKNCFLSRDTIEEVVAKKITQHANRKDKDSDTTIAAAAA
jgi:hypothetical protein